MECRFCKDQKKVMYLLIEDTDDGTRVHATMDSSSAEANITISVKPHGEKMSFCGFNINYCPFCGKELRRENKTN